MGTLGCINDMQRRDKENRELRKLGRERIKETKISHGYLQLCRNFGRRSGRNPKKDKRKNRHGQ